jgi:hypothetical protein
MGDIAYDRCPNDDFRAGSAQVGVNPKTGQSVELNINGVGAVVSIHAALLSLSMAMKAGYEEGFLEKVALVLAGKLECDPHALCPLLTTLSMCLALVSKAGEITFNEEGHITIVFPDDDDPSGTITPCPGPECMYSSHEENDDEPHEPPMDRDGEREDGLGDSPMRERDKEQEGGGAEDSGDGINPEPGG